MTSYLIDMGGGVADGQTAANPRAAVEKNLTAMDVTDYTLTEIWSGDSDTGCITVGAYSKAAMQAHNGRSEWPDAAPSHVWYFRLELPED